MSAIAKKTLVAQIAKSGDSQWDTANAEGGSVAYRGISSTGIISWNPDHTFTCTVVTWTGTKRREFSRVVMGARASMTFVSARCI